MDAVDHATKTCIQGLHMILGVIRSVDWVDENTPSVIWKAQVKLKTLYKTQLRGFLRIKRGQGIIGILSNGECCAVTRGVDGLVYWKGTPVKKT